MDIEISFYIKAEFNSSAGRQVEVMGRLSPSARLLPSKRVK
jgi:hypothetical protein